MFSSFSFSSHLETILLSDGLGTRTATASATSSPSFMFIPPEKTKWDTEDGLCYISIS